MIYYLIAAAGAWQLTSWLFGLVDRIERSTYDENDI